MRFRMVRLTSLFVFFTWPGINQELGSPKFNHLAGSSAPKLARLHGQ